jgi:hypothetical protein
MDLQMDHLQYFLQVNFEIISIMEKHNLIKINRFSQSYNKTNQNKLKQIT